MDFKYWDTNSDLEKTLFYLLINLSLIHTRFRQNHLQNVSKSHCIWTTPSVVDTKMIRLIESRMDIFQVCNLSSQIDCFIEFHRRQFTRLLVIENVEIIVLVVSVLDFRGMHHKLMFVVSISSLLISVWYKSHLSSILQTFKWYVDARVSVTEMTSLIWHRKSRLFMT